MANFYGSLIGFGGGGALGPFAITGGTDSEYSYDGTDYKIHKFTSSGSNDCIVSGLVDRTVDVLVIAGGGGGASGLFGVSNGGGGGAGGLRWLTGQTVATGTYTATVGAAGASPVGSAATKGGDSSFIGTGLSITATGGGRGAFVYNPSDVGDGGSGGGSMYSTIGQGNEGSFTPVEGYNGGNGSPGANSTGAGGGGSGGLGGNTSAPTAGGGGGVGEDDFLNQSSAAFSVAATKALLDEASLGEVSGSNRYIAAGGGGGGTNSTTGGTGGGGDSASGYSGAGTDATHANSGSGGGGSGHSATQSTAGAGADGCIIVRYTV